MTIAALWDTWQDKSENKQIESCTMVITEPNKFVADIHDRMPVILERDHFETWVRTDNLREAAELMKPAGEGVLQKRPVSRRVNSSKATADAPTLIEEVKLAA